MNAIEIQQPPCPIRVVSRSGVSSFGRALLTVGAGLAIVCAVQADTYRFVIDPARSNLSLAADNSVHIEGTFIGDFDSEGNPGGTKTRNGYFGGQDNEAVAFTTDAGVAGEGQTAPGGGFTVTLFPDTMTLSISGLSLDLLAGGELSLPLTVALDFDTFRTFNPDSLYIGGLLPPIEVGEAMLTALTAAQSGPGGGTLTPNGPDAFDFEAVVDAALTLEMSVLDQPVAPGPVPAPLALVGTITLGENGMANLVMSVEQAIRQDISVDGVGFEDVPVDLPTILPPGYTAHLLMDGQVESASVDMALGLSIIAGGTRTCPADFDGNGLLDIFDFLAFQNAFVAEAPEGDFNGDGAFDLFDFLAFVNAFSDGC